MLSPPPLPGQWSRVLAIESTSFKPPKHPKLSKPLAIPFPIPEVTQGNLLFELEGATSEPHCTNFDPKRFTRLVSKATSKLDLLDGDILAAPIPKADPPRRKPKKKKRKRIISPELTALNGLQTFSNLDCTRPSNSNPLSQIDCEPLMDKFGYCKILTYNVRSLRSLFQKSPTHLLFQGDFDIVCLTEVQSDIDGLHKYPALWGKISLRHRYSFWNSCTDLTLKTGYSGTAIFTSSRPQSVTYGFDDDETPDTEGRLITLLFKDVAVICCYSPSILCPDKSYRTQHRLQFDRRLAQHAAKIRALMPVILCGDFNVAHTNADCPDGALPPPVGMANRSIPEREGFDKIIASSQTQDCHPTVPGKTQYSWYREPTLKKSIRCAAKRSFLGSQTYHCYTTQPSSSF